MAEEVKTTLFRFTTVRAVEKVTDEQNNLYYIKHPDGTSGDFFGALEEPLGELTKRQVLLDVAEGFTHYTNKAAIAAINADLFAFAEWLFLNRSTLTYASVDAQITTLNPDPLTSLQLLAVWDNLFYQVLTMDSPYLREYLIQLLVANHYLDHFDEVTIGDDIGALKLAISTVALPKNMFSLDNNITTSDQFDNGDEIDQDALNKHLYLAKAKLATEKFNKLKSEIVGYENKWTKANAAGYKAAADAWVVSYNTEYTDKIADTTVETDPNNGFMYAAMPPDFSIPEFDYTPEPQIDEAVLEVELSEEALYTMQSNNLIDSDTLNEVKVKVSDLIVGENDKIFQGTALNRTVVEHSGTPIYASDVILGKLYSYGFTTVKSSPNKYSILMVLYTGSNQSKVNSLTYTLGAPVSATFSTFKTMGNGNYMISVNLTPEIPVGITEGTTSISFEGELKLLGGIVLNWNFTFNPTKHNFGTMTNNTPMSNNSVYIPSGFGITRLGLAEYKKVEQYLCCYHPGEVSHIENILAKEYKERSTRRLRSAETTTTSTTETEREVLTDTTSTSRFEMQEHISEVLSQDQSFNAGANARYSNSVASVDLSTNFAFNKSKQSSNEQSVTFAKDITQKALERVVQKVKQERIDKIREEFEEQNKHGFDNRQGINHISGVYRWVDKVYKNQIVNYGMRMHYEFMIPEPSRLHYYAKSGNSKVLIEPVDPRKFLAGVIDPISDASRINEGNYRGWAAQFNAQVSPPPSEVIMIGKGYTKSQGENDGNAENDKCIADEIRLPDGYGLDSVFVAGFCKRNWVKRTGEVALSLDPASEVGVAVADVCRHYKDCEPIKQNLFLQDTNDVSLEQYTTGVPVTVHFYHIWSGHVNVNLKLRRKPELYAQWQLDTFNSIISAYEEKLSAYQDRLAEEQAKKGQLLGTNPGYYREIENTILKKNCISYMVGHANMGNVDYTKSDKFSEFQIMNDASMDTYSAKVKFFEQAFDWDIMSYTFYPFYWAFKERWVDLYNYENDDPLFRSFMRAGMARVFVTVRPGFEQAVAIYMETGQIWNGGQVPTIDDELYISLVEEMKTKEGVIEDTWESKVPSSLTLIQKDSVSLDASGLPCWCDEETPPVEAINPSTALLEGNAP
jgi:hypothetical protein